MATRQPAFLALSIVVVMLAGCWLDENISVEEIRQRAAGAPHEIPAGIAVMSENEIRETIIGNSLAGPSAIDGSPIAEYLAPNGSVEGLYAGNTSSGHWTVSGSLLCIYYPLRTMKSAPRKESMFHCRTLAFDGELISYYDQHGRPADKKSLLLQGNAKDL